MQSHWLNKQNNDKLIIFFAGWSFDYKPFEFLDCTDYDVLMVYDYYHTPRPLREREKFVNELCEFTNLGEGSYSAAYLLAWSIGSFRSLSNSKRTAGFY